MLQAAFLSDGRSIVSLDEEGGLRTWSFPGGAPGHVLETGVRPRNRLLAVPGTSAFLIAGEDAGLFRFDADSGAFGPVDATWRPVVAAMAVSADGSRIWVQEREGRVHVCAPNGRGRVTLRQAEPRPQTVPFFRSAGARVAVFDKTEKRVFEYDAISGARLSGSDRLDHLRRYSTLAPPAERFPFLWAALIGHQDLLRPTDLAVVQKLSSDKRLFVQRAQVGERLYLLQHPDLVWIYRGEPRREEPVVSEQAGYVSLLRPLSEHEVVVGTFLGDVTLVDLRDGQSRPLGRPFSAAVWTAARSDDGKLLALGAADHTARLVSLPDGVVTREWTLDAPVTYVAFSRDGRRLHAVTHKALHTLELGGEAARSPIPVGLVFHNGPPVAPSRDRIAFSVREGELSVLELDSGRVIRFDSPVPLLHRLGHHFVQMLEGDVLIAQDRDHCLQWFHWPQTQPRARYCGFRYLLTSAAIDRAQGLLLATADDATVRVWSLATGRQVLLVPTVIGQAAAFLPGGSSAVFESGDQVLRLPLDPTLLSMPAADLMSLARRLSGLGLDGTRLRPLHELASPAMH